MSSDGTIFYFIVKTNSTLNLSRIIPLKQWGFENKGVSGRVWTADLLCDLLKKRGPLICSGWFPPAELGQKIIHCIVVYGYAEAFGGVYYINPYEGILGKMDLQSFCNKLYGNSDSVQALKVYFDKDSFEGDPVLYFKKKREIEAETESYGQGQLPPPAIDPRQRFEKVPEFIKVPDSNIKRK